VSLNIPGDLLYTTDDEWLRLEGDEAVVGITDYAQDSLSDIVYLELPNTGATFSMGETFGVVESVKAASDLLMPVAGEVLAANEALIDGPEAVNSDPYGEAWMVRIKLTDKSQLAQLMDATAYQAYCAERE
jgi:glycine cleavage system H protein